MIERNILSQNISIRIDGQIAYIFSNLLPSGEVLIKLEQGKNVENQILEYFSLGLDNLTTHINSIESNFLTKGESKHLQIQLIKGKQVFHELEEIFDRKGKLSSQVNELVNKILSQLEN